MVDRLTPSNEQLAQSKFDLLNVTNPETGFVDLASVGKVIGTLEKGEEPPKAFSVAVVDGYLGQLSDKYPQGPFGKILTGDTSSESYKNNPEVAKQLVAGIEQGITDLENQAKGDASSELKSRISAYNFMRNFVQETYVGDEIVWDESEGQDDRIIFEEDSDGIIFEED